MSKHKRKLKPAAVPSNVAREILRRARGRHQQDKPHPPKGRFTGSR